MLSQAREEKPQTNNAVITNISNGQVEGQVNRIKTIKRKMYGKAGFQLLRKMVLAKSA
ncbi:transposase [Pedobacter kyonggii]|uniref:Transposase n=1 Tax=Pedobacter kyonggii TaxID=1926871 RepID=A0A4Q9HH31_9SPHI|nr:transposase [Pedobacter kyonggii]